MPTFRFDNKIPVPSGDPVRDIEGLRNSMYMLVENLQYMFNNLDDSNLGADILKFGDENGSASFEIDVDGIVAEVRKKVGGDYAELTMKLELTANGLASTVDRVTKLESSQGTVDENLKTEIIQSAKGVTLDAVALTYETKAAATTTKTALETSISTSAKGVLSTVSETYETIASADATRKNLADNYYNKSTIDQKVGEIKLSVNTNGKEISLTLNGETQKIDLSGYVSFTNLSTAGQTTINGGNITTGTISADRIRSGTLESVAIKGVTITGGTISSTRTSGGYTYEVNIANGTLLSVRHTGNVFTSSNAACALDPVEGLTLGTYGEAYGEIYTEGTVLKIYGKGGIHLNGKAMPGGFSLSEFANNAIAMATAYTTTSGTSGGGDISMTGITEMDSVGVFSRARYSSSYGYGILCNKAGYYLVSAEANLNTTSTAESNTIGIRKVVGGTSSFIAKNTEYAHSNGGTVAYTQVIAPRVVYLEANSYLSLYSDDSTFKTTADGCWITAVYLGI